MLGKECVTLVEGLGELRLPGTRRVRLLLRRDKQERIEVTWRGRACCECVYVYERLTSDGRYIKVRFMGKVKIKSYITGKYEVAKCYTTVQTCWWRRLDISGNGAFEYTQ